ncbi:putative divergent AAA domain family [Candidatus Kuenenia stuttgartiensis]|uniref:Putative divergent AAA domain family n=1 Tax=Kuenenia stuttgartiensis TaxID=174633 RepID=A0A6G7GSL2_KUEST|nr:ATP-binding protein [Candidatus Kuenenia stuttgartiensis]QII12556.1 putative divergent AAA domain family [Candidatus Kuenenia stuttgartiensis]
MKIRWYNFKSFMSFVVLGGLVGVVILHPLTMVIYWYEFNPPESFNLSLFKYFLCRLGETFTGRMLSMTIIFSALGGCLGLFFGVYHKVLVDKKIIINLLARELERDLTSLIKEAETENLEFKSSARWDYRQNKLNKALESVIVKTIAGFMNNRGGTLLIGIDDEGQPVGLEKDYTTLKRKDSDGYEQFIMGLVSSKVGSNHCSNIKIIFHKLEAKEICRIIIEPSSRPVYYREGNDVQFCLRTGGGTRELNVQEATEYITHHWPNR